LNLNPFKKKRKDDKYDNPESTKERVNKNISRKRESEREKKRKDEYFEMFKGLFGDRDYRTKQGLINALLFLVSISGVIFFTFVLISGIASWESHKQSNTTPIGDEIKFQKSGATLNFGGVWTDKKRDVTAIKLKYDKKARNKLSTRGESYKLYLIDSEGKLTKKDVKVSYGILTQGDGFLFIKGHLSKKAYQIVLTNQSDIDVTSSTDDDYDEVDELNDDESTTSSTDRLARQSKDEVSDADIEESLSELKQGDVSKKGHLDFGSGKDKKEEPNVDYASFRVNVFSDSTKVFNGSFLDKDNNIDYGKVVEQSSTKDAIKNIDKKIAELEEIQDKNDESLDELEYRVKRDKNDEDSKESIESIKGKQEKNKEKVENYKSLKERYEKYDITKDSFDDMQEEFKILNSLKK
jgi:hypothetical protein